MTLAIEYELMVWALTGVMDRGTTLAPYVVGVSLWVVSWLSRRLQSNVLPGSPSRLVLTWK